MITNQLGQIVLSESIEGQKVNLGNLEKGVYVISISSSDGNVYSEKLIKE